MLSSAPRRPIDVLRTVVTPLVLEVGCVLGFVSGCHPPGCARPRPPADGLGIQRAVKPNCVLTSRGRLAAALLRTARSPQIIIMPLDSYTLFVSEGTIARG